MNLIFGRLTKPDVEIIFCNFYFSYFQSILKFLSTLSIALSNYFVESFIFKQFKIKGFVFIFFNKS